jgi:hypothetical protein
MNNSFFPRFLSCPVIFCHRVGGKLVKFGSKLALFGVKVAAFGGEIA